MTLPTKRESTLRGYPVAVTCLAIYVSATWGCATGESTSVASPSSVTLRGTLTGIESTPVELLRAGEYVGHTFERVAETVSQDGRFEFTAPMDDPEMHYLKVGDSRTYYEVFLEAGTIEIGLDAEAGTAPIVIGSVSHDRFREIEARLTKLRAEAADLSEVSQAATERGDRAAALQADSARQLSEDRHTEITHTWVLRNADSPVAGYLAARHLYANMQRPELEVLVETLDPALSDHRYQALLHARLEALETTSVGARTPAFSLPNRDGETISITDFDGSYVLIDFWASWCGPCREQNPTLKQIYSEFAPGGLEILGVGLEFSQQAWLGALDADELPWPNVCDVSGFDTVPAKIYGIRSLPSNVLLGPDGRILARNLEAEELRREIRRLLG